MPHQSIRVIAHLDMDAFYASVELLRYPELKGRPVVVGGGRRSQPEETIDPATGGRTRRFARLGDYAGRGVATTASYEARALGVHSAMGLMKAARLAPEAVLLPADFDAYRSHSRRFKAAVARLAPQIEDRGIDEIYVDLTEVVAARAPRDEGETWREARAVAQAIKQAVRDATGLSCSIGLTPNKLLSKIASELDKPDGLTIVALSEIAARIWPLPARKINGIGPKTAERLASLNIRTIGELAQTEREWLIERFGKALGSWMHEAAHGRDERPVVTHSEPKSISRETTFERDLHAKRDRDALSRIFTELCVELSEDLCRAGYAGRTIGLKLRYDNFRTVTRDQTIAAPTQDAQTIRRTAGECLKRVPLDRRIRLLGVRIGGLTPAEDAAAAAPAAAEPTASLFE
ncbi:MAG TPA: DNA polymerase IV [Casimicrobiaceae bacterium]|nr:DNA polymerase IV [Casimicrobiaceae bacterium]